MNKSNYIKIAYWYYVLNLTQDEIAKRLSVTRQSINSIINSLVSNGFVSINVHGYEREHIEMESFLEERFGLDQAIVASNYTEDADDPKAEMYKVTNVAAQYLQDTIKQGDIVGVSWGRTLSMTVDQMDFLKRGKCIVLQMMGAQNIASPTEKSDEISRDLADKLDCPCRMLYAPVFVEDKMTKELLLKEKPVQSSFDLMDKCNLAVLGIGNLSIKSTMHTSGILREEVIHRLRDAGFVADISMNPIRSDGSWDDCPVSGHIISADMECLKKISNTIVIACGSDKVRAIHAVLQAGCVNTFITGRETAQKIMDYDKGNLV